MRCKVYLSISHTRAKLITAFDEIVRCNRIFVPHTNSRQMMVDNSTYRNIMLVR